MKSQLVLLDIFSYSCMNCLRSLGYIKKIDSRYKKYGLKTILVHPPEWKFEKNAEYILHALKKYNIKLPVILDKNKKIIKKLDISFWPTQMLMKNGAILYKHIGEGNYKRLEDRIRKLLKISVNKIFKKEPRYTKLPTIYLGIRKNSLVKNIDKLEFGVIQTKGNWLQENEYLKSMDEDCLVTVLTKGNIINFVAKSSHNKPLEIGILLNNKFIKKITIKEPRLYEILRLKNNKRKKLTLQAKSGLEIYSFSFQ